MTLKTTHDVAIQFNLTPRTLRFWHEKELLFPKHADNGVRSFDDVQIGRLKLILKGKRVGMEVEEIRECLTDTELKISDDLLTELNLRALTNLRNADAVYGAVSRLRVLRKGVDS